jgi:hypothetical protein
LDFSQNQSRNCDCQDRFQTERRATSVLGCPRSAKVIETASGLPATRPEQRRVRKTCEKPTFEEWCANADQFGNRAFPPSFVPDLEGGRSESANSRLDSRTPNDDNRSVMGADQMPQQELFFEQKIGDRLIEIVKT